ncbi:hypothetical protein A6P54_13045 [Bacillus sp. MKU004]|nr:hypothetical protein A6P54_13045 [Bacillus sp. MKU004]
MEQIDIVLLSIGFIVLLLAFVLLILKLVKGTGGVSPGLISLLLIGFMSIAAGVILLIPELKGKLLEAAGTEGTKTAVAEIEPAKSTLKKSAFENETKVQEMARKLVEQEMEKQVGLRDWEITKNQITSDQELYNIADYDKPEGEMRKV